MLSQNMFENYTIFSGQETQFLEEQGFVIKVYETLEMDFFSALKTTKDNLSIEITKKRTFDKTYAYYNTRYIRSILSVNLTTRKMLTLDAHSLITENISAFEISTNRIIFAISLLGQNPPFKEEISYSDLRKSINNLLIRHSERNSIYMYKYKIAFKNDDKSKFVLRL